MPTDVTGLPPAVDQAQFDLWRERRLPPTALVRPGVWSLSIPFQDNPMLLTYCYVLTGPDGAYLVDPGWDSDEGFELFLAGLAEIGVAPADVVGIVVTHFHPDHLAMAARVAAATGAWAGLHPADQAVIAEFHSATARKRRDRWLRWAQAPEDLLALDSTRSRLMDRFETGPLRDLADGEVLRTAAGPARLLHTPGHTPGHLCVVLDEAELLLSGDHILPKVSPTIAFGVDRSVDPLGDYLDSLRRCAELGDYEVAGAHEYRFTGLAQRVDRLIAEHGERGEEVAAALDAGHRSLWEIAANISWRRGWDGLDPVNRLIAISETECHLAHLARVGRITWETFES